MFDIDCLFNWPVNLRETSDSKSMYVKENRNDLYILREILDLLTPPGHEFFKIDYIIITSIYFIESVFQLLMIHF